MKLTLLPGRFAVCRLDPSAAVAPWAASSTFLSITRTASELSIVCDEGSVPGEVRSEGGWRCLEVAGPIPFETTGVAAALTAPLATARISVFLISTFDTDYLLVKEVHIEEALAVLRGAGFQI
ncbi:MAG: hypothetical protein JWO56_665 [Acidobacteria bacterium]|nr:hypothetical protein [Acidobacteriota bacterium]